MRTTYTVRYQHAADDDKGPRTGYVGDDWGRALANARGWRKATAVSEVRIDIVEEYSVKLHESAEYYAKEDHS